jgi:hypothetical protein
MTAPAFRTATTFTEYTLHNISTNTKTYHHTPKNHFYSGVCGLGDPHEGQTTTPPPPHPAAAPTWQIYFITCKTQVC